MSERKYLLTYEKAQLVTVMKEFSNLKDLKEIVKKLKRNKLISEIRIWRHCKINDKKKEI